MKDKVKCTFEKERSNEVELVASNLEAILKSSTYKLAHEDINLLNTDEMRGVRMLLEITKPEQVIEKENIISTVIVFGGVHISEEITSKRRLDDAVKLLTKNPKSKSLKINNLTVKNLENCIKKLVKNGSTKKIPTITPPTTKPKVTVVNQPGTEEVDASQTQLPTGGNREIPSFDATLIRSSHKMEVLGISA